MRKFTVLAIVEVVLWAGVVVMDISGLASLYNLPVMGSILGLSLLLLLSLLLPDLKAWLDPNKRIIRQGRSRAEKDRESRLTARVRAARKTGILWNIAHDPATDRISGDLFQRSRKSRWVDYAIWLMNRRQVNRSKRLRSIFYWFVQRLGYAVREAREGEIEDGLSR